MTKRYWVVGGDYQDAAFSRIVPGTEKMIGPFADELRARNEWMRHTYRPEATATTRYTIATESVR